MSGKLTRSRMAIFYRDEIEPAKETIEDAIHEMSSQIIEGDKKIIVDIYLTDEEDPLAD